MNRKEAERLSFGCGVIVKMRDGTEARAIVLANAGKRLRVRIYGAGVWFVDTIIPIRRVVRRTESESCPS